MKRFYKIYLEISNICNLSCSFCPGTKRPLRSMSESEFAAVLPKISPYTDYVYFHLMGEPLLHSSLAAFLKMAGDAGLKVIITTNGTLLRESGDLLLSADSLHKVNISLHSFEANDLSVPFSEYLDGCFEFGKNAAGKKIVVYRLWNKGGEDSANAEILERLKAHFPEPFSENRCGYRLCEKVFLEYGDKFDWPDMSADDGGDDIRCYGLRDQIGILSDGSVVPCCLDHEGDITLGNIFESDLCDIISSERATRMLDGFKKGKASEELCRRCGYARQKFG